MKVINKEFKLKLIESNNPENLYTKHAIVMRLTTGKKCNILFNVDFYMINNHNVL